MVFKLHSFIGQKEKSVKDEWAKLKGISAAKGSEKNMLEGLF